MFNFEAAIKEGQDLRNGGLVTAILLGQQGAGKSRVIGTFPGKVLYLYALGESHGPESAASVLGSDVVPVCFDFENGVSLSSDDAYLRLLAILAAAAKKKDSGFYAIALDSVTELEAIIRESQQFKLACQTAKMEHNKYLEAPVTIKMLRVVMNAMLHAQRKLNCHLAVTCALDVKDRAADGEILEAVPRLQGYSVAETVVRMFADVLVIGEMERNGTVKHRFQFNAEVSKISQDMKSGAVKKMLNLRPRITGVENLPATVEADMSLIVQLKEGK